MRILLLPNMWDQLIRIYGIVESEAISFAFIHQKFAIRHGFNPCLLDYAYWLEIFDRLFAESEAVTNMIIVDVLFNQYRKVETPYFFYQLKALLNGYSYFLAL